MRKRYQEITHIVETSKAGHTGAMKRGYNHIEKDLIEGARSRGIRKPGAGCQWRWGKHQRKISKWITRERLRSHTIGMADVKDEWIDMLTAEIAEIRASQAMTKDESLWVEEMERKKHSLMFKDRKPQRRMSRRCSQRLGQGWEHRADQQT